MATHIQSGATLVVFDVDGTLTQTNGMDAACFVRVMEAVPGMGRIDTNWAGYRRVTDSGIVEELFQRHLSRPATPEEMLLLEDQVATAVQAEIERNRAICREIDGAAAMLACLSAIPGVAVAIATGGWARSARAKLAAAGLGAFSFPLATCNDSSAREDIMLTAMRRVMDADGGRAFDRIVYVGDGVWDVRASVNLGWHFVGIGRGEGAERLRSLGAGVVLPDYRDIDGFRRAVGV